MQDVVNGEVMSEYEKFLNAKRHTIGNFGFEPLFIPKIAFDFQKHIIEKSIRKGRIATKIDQIIYSLGAMIGGLSGLFITSIML